MAYRPSETTDRWKAITAVIAVHVVLGVIIVTGLNVDTVRRAVDHLQTFDITLPEPPPPKEPPPKLEPNRAKEKEPAPAAPKPSPVVAPKPEVQLPSRQNVAAAPRAGTGASSSAGQGGVGTGTGAGGVGTGRGGGGGNTAARLVRNLTSSDYRRLTSNRLRSGSVAMAIRVNTSGRVDSCKVIRSSGDSVIDSGICSLVASRLRFSPARNAQGQPIPYYTNYLATWNR